MERQCHVTVEKILFRGKGSIWTVFKGTVLRWSARKKCFLPTKEAHIFVGNFFCIFVGDQFEVTAKASFHQTYGSQYIVSQSKREEPVTVGEIRLFLRQIKGMTPKRIEKVLEKYGADTLYQMKTDAHALDFLGIDPIIIDTVRQMLLHNEAFERTMAFLLLHDIDGRLAFPLVKKYGDGTVSILEGNPYMPYMDNIFDIRTADRLWSKLKKPASDDTRCLYITLAALRLDVQRNGNVFTRRSALKEKMSVLLSETTETIGFPFTEEQLSAAVNRLEEIGVIVLDCISDDVLLYIKRNYYDETHTARRIQEIINTPKRVVFSDTAINTALIKGQQNTGIVLAKGQTKAVYMALTSAVSILSGGPGTGKTQTITAIVSAVKEIQPDAVIRICAPTGKAAIRAAELTGIAASTIHRAIGIKEFMNDYLKNGELKCDLLIVDEFSMADINLCAKLFDAMTPNGRVLLVGDSNQLPSVGPGLVLRDFMDSEVIPSVVLDQIFRQAQNSRITINAHRIIHQPPTGKICLKTAKKPGEDFYFIEESDPRKILKCIARSVRRLEKQYGYGIDAVQVLSPVKNGDLGTQQLNHFLQRLYHQNDSALSIEYEDKEFFLHDKVIHTRNNYQLKVFNGEIGEVTEIVYMGQKTLKVTYPGGRDVWYSVSDLAELEPAYAITVHKMQGSECPVIIMPVHEMQGIALSKNLIYTALTRAKKMVILIGSASSLSAGLRREIVSARESRLKERLCTAQTQKQLS